MTTVVWACALTLPFHSWGAAPVQTQGETGLLYTITHLHPTIYVILFCVFVLSAINLAVQNRLVTRIQTLLKLTFWGNISRDRANPGGFIQSFGDSNRPKTFRKSIRGPESYRMSKEPLKDGIVSVRPASHQSSAPTLDGIPTPLDGEDHPIPEFGVSSKAKSKTSRNSEAEREKSLSTKEFRFSSAVDLPSPEEIERRDKEKIVVSGRVIDPSDDGLATAVVYLVDKDGNKMGQSCRTNGESGSYRVQSNESGAHSINVYKRGYVMNSAGPIKLPAKSGKIEGFDISMIPEGCLIHGKVVSLNDLAPLSGLTVNCACRSEQFKLSTTTNSDGVFQAFGAPLNSECEIQVLSGDGKLLLSSKPFETVQKKQIFMELKVENPAVLKDETATDDFDDIEIIVAETEPDTPIHTNPI